MTSSIPSTGLLSREILIVENLNLEAVAGRRFYGEAFPLPIRGGDAAPARVCAVLELSGTDHEALLLQ